MYIYFQETLKSAHIYALAAPSRKYLDLTWLPFFQGNVHLQFHVLDNNPNICHSSEKS